MEWGSDTSTLFYTVPDNLRRPHRVYRRRLSSALVTSASHPQHPICDGLSAGMWSI